MFDLGFKKNIFLGIDVGTSAIKIVEVTFDSNNKPTLSNYAWMPLSGALVEAGRDANFFESVLPELLRHILKKGRFKAKDAYISLPALDGLITLIDFPDMAPEDMEQAVRFEAQKYIPTSLEEVVLSWDVIEKEAGTSNENKQELGVMAASAIAKKNKVLLVAASRARVQRYEKLVKSLDLRLGGVEIESFSLVSSLLGSDKGTFIIVDIGFQVCNILFVKKGVIQSNRNINTGGKSLTQTIAKNMGVDEERAEKVKRSERNFFGTESFIKFISLDLIIDEIKRIGASVSGEKDQQQIDGVILSGGTAKLGGIAEYFSSELGMKTIVGNPFGRVKYDPRLEIALSEIGTQFSVSVGLAFKGVETSNKKA